MSVYGDEEPLVYDVNCEDQVEIVDNLSSSHIDKDGEPPTVTMEQEKRIRREIANSNERRRMQSINNGFQSLRSLLPHHEGEKLSKAAILQQTAEYIYSLEQEKTHLLSQNCHLKRLVNQHEGGELPPKKRPKIMDTNPLILPTKSESSSDEGLGSMSPEPLHAATVAAETKDLKLELDRERNLRLILEEQLRQMEDQLYQFQRQNTATIVYSSAMDVHGNEVDLQLHDDEQEEIVLDNQIVLPDDVADDEEGEEIIDENSMTEEMLVVADDVPVVGNTQTVQMCSSEMRSRSPSPLPPLMPKLTIVRNGQQSNLQKVVTIHKSETAKPPTLKSAKGLMRITSVTGGVGKTISGGVKLIVKSDNKRRLPSVLEAAIKAEPKVEVERLPSQSPSPHDETRIYATNRSRQNLETIVEAIRHLEGDHMFAEDQQHQQDQANKSRDKPLPLTKTITLAKIKKEMIKEELSPFLDCHSTPKLPPTVNVQQVRPGVIVVKQPAVPSTITQVVTTAPSLTTTPPMLTSSRVAS